MLYCNDLLAYKFVPKLIFTHPLGLELSGQEWTGEKAQLQSYESAPRAPLGELYACINFLI